MPYKIENQGGERPWKIINSETGDIVGSSLTKKDAKTSARIRMQTKGEYHRGENPGNLGSSPKKETSMKTCRPCLGADIKEAIKTHVRNPEVDKVLEKIKTCPAPTKIKVCGSTAKKPKAKKIRKIYYDPDKGPPQIPEGYEVVGESPKAQRLR